MDANTHLRPLNPVLYQALRARFGNVDVANEGIAMCGTPRLQSATAYSLGSTGGYAPDLLGNPFSAPRRRHSPVLTWGEYYRVNCPFCRESQRRLWINHLYGTKDENGIPQQWLAHCYNEKCTTDPTARSLLEQQIFGLGYRQLTPILPGENISAELQAVQPPGHVVPLHELPADHRARTYLLGRRFDPDFLSRTYGVGYVVQADPRFIGMQGRIYIPIWMNGQLVSWQGRWPEDLNWKQVSIPKYCNRPGPKGRMFYNNDTALHWPFVVVVEGIPSVWRIGGPAVSMLGKSMTGPQRLLLQRWAGKPIIVMLDPDAFLESEGLLRELRTMVQSPVIEVRLPDRYDPGDYSHEADVAMICNAAAQQRIALSAW